MFFFSIYLSIYLLIHSFFRLYVQLIGLKPYKNPKVVFSPLSPCAHECHCTRFCLHVQSESTWWAASAASRHQGDCWDSLTCVLIALLLLLPQSFRDATSSSSIWPHLPQRRRRRAPVLSRATWFLIPTPFLSRPWPLLPLYFPAPSRSAWTREETNYVLLRLTGNYSLGLMHISTSY